MKVMVLKRHFHFKKDEFCGSLETILNSISYSYEILENFSEEVILNYALELRNKNNPANVTAKFYPQNLEEIFHKYIPKIYRLGCWDPESMEGIAYAFLPFNEDLDDKCLFTDVVVSLKAGEEIQLNDQLSWYYNN